MCLAQTRKALRITHPGAIICGGWRVLAGPVRCYKCHMHRLLYRTASVETHAFREISMAHVSGVVTPDTLRLIIADSAQWAGGCDHLAHVVDYSGATMALSLDRMVEMARAAKRADAINATPSALIVSADQMPLFENYTTAMQRLGFSMAAFTASDEGRQWAARQALVREHWRGLRAALRQSAP